MIDRIKKWFFQRIALNYMTSGDSLKAELWYRRYEKTDPDSIAAIHNLGVLYIALKRYDDAERYLLREIDLFGKSDLRYRILGDLYYSWGKRSKASAAYGESLAMIKTYGGSSITARFLKKRIKQCGDKALYGKALQGMTLFEDGMRHFRDGNYDRALELYSEAARFDSSNFAALNEAGTIMMNRFMDYRSAERLFRKALDLAEIPVIRRNLALAEQRIREGVTER